LFIVLGLARKSRHFRAAIIAVLIADRHQLMDRR